MNKRRGEMREKRKRKQYRIMFHIILLCFLDTFAENFSAFSIAPENKALFSIPTVIWGNTFDDQSLYSFTINTNKPSSKEYTCASRDSEGKFCTLYPIWLITEPI